MIRASRIAVALLVLLVLVVPIGTGLAGPSSAVPCGKPRGDGWYTIPVGGFPIGSADITAFALEHENPSHLYVTNGHAVRRSVDGGCSWTDSYRLPAVAGVPDGYTASDSRIVALEVAGSSVYLGVQQDGVVQRPHVVRSGDRGESWEAADGGELGAAVGVLKDLAVSESAAQPAYALVDVSVSDGSSLDAETGSAVYRTENGSAWSRQNPVGGDGVDVSVAQVGITVNDPRVLTGIELDDSDPSVVWTFGEGATFRSGDGGRTFTPVSEEAGVIDIQPLAGGASQTFLYPSKAATLYLSRDRGASFLPIPLPGVVDSAGHGSGADDVMIGSGGKVFLMGPPIPGSSTPAFYDVSPKGGIAIQDVTGAMSPTIYGHGGRTIEVRPLAGFTYPTLPYLQLPQLAGLDVTIDPSDLARFGDGELLPRRTFLELDRGEKRRVDYTLHLPPAPTPLDVYFLIDVSGSMGSTIRGVATGMQEIVTRLSDMGIDVRFGVGIYRSFEDPPAYERVRDILPVGAGLAEAFNSLQAEGGGNETQLYALLRSVGGVEGLDDGFTFRPGSLRVAINATDEPISTGGQHPDYTRVIEALNAASVRQVGLAIQPEETGGLLGSGGAGELPSEGLIRVAEGTDAVAPSQGVDCDGDGSSEIAPGEALVCKISPERSGDAGIMADAIANVLASIEDLADLHVTATPAEDAAAGAEEIVQRIAPRGFRHIDLKKRHSLRFSVDYECPEVRESTDFPFDVRVSHAGGVLGEGRTVVRCSPRPIPVVPPVPPAIAAPVVPAAPPLPVARIPQPQPNPQPNPQPQTQPQAQSQAQSQASLVTQRQTQPQFAFARVSSGLSRSVAAQPVMTGVKSRRQSLTSGRLVLGMVAVSLMGATSGVLARRTQWATARVRRR